MVLVASNARRFYPVRLKTGKVGKEIEPFSVSRGSRLNGGGKLDLGIDLSDNKHYKLALEGLKEKRDGFIEVVNGKIVESAYITGRDGIDKVEYSTAGIIDLLDFRHIWNVAFNPATDNPIKQKVTLANKTPRSIAALLLRMVLDNPNFSNIPMRTYDIENEVGTTSVEYLGEDFVTVQDAFEKLIEEVDLQIVAEFVDGTESLVTWGLRAGDPLLMQEGEPHVFDASGPRSLVTVLDPSIDGSGIVTRSWALGSPVQFPDGTSAGDSVAVGTAENDILKAAEYPTIEVKETYDVGFLSATLADHAMMLLRDGSTSWTTWAFSSEVKDVSAYRPGDFAHIWVGPEHRSIPEGKHLVRIVSIDDSTSSVVTFGLQPMPVTWDNFDPNKIPRRYFDIDPLRTDDKKKTDTSKVKYSGEGGNMGTVVTFNAIDNTARVLIENGGEVDTRVAMDGKTLYPGDKVAVLGAKSGDDIVVNRRPSDSPGGTGVRYRVTDGWPKDAYNLDLAYGMSFVDENDAFGFGAGAVIIDSDTPNNVYNEVTGVTARIVPPIGFSWIPRAKHVYGNYGFSWFKETHTGTPYLFQRSASSPTGWEMVRPMPESRDNRVNGWWQEESLSKEVRTRPVVAIGRIYDDYYAGSNSPYYAPVEITVKILDPGVGWNDWVVRTLISTPMFASGTMMVPEDARVYTKVHSCGRYVYVAVNVVIGSLQTQKRLMLLDPEAPENERWTFLGETFEGFLGVDSATPIRMGYDALLYAAQKGYLYRRGIGYVGPKESQYDSVKTSDPFPGYPQRDGESERYFIAALSYFDGVNTNLPVGSVFEHVPQQETERIITATSGNGTYSPNLSLPVQTYDGSIYVNMDTERNSAAHPQSGRVHGLGHKIYKMVPPSSEGNLEDQ